MIGDGNLDDELTRPAQAGIDSKRLSASALPAICFRAKRLVTAGLRAMFLRLIQNMN
jgi:hypothetical protein